MLRRRDILQGLEPRFLVGDVLPSRLKFFDMQVDPNLAEMSWEKVVDGFHSLAERPVSEVMQPIVATVSHEDHITKVINEMVASNVSLLPVLRQRRVIGVVRSIDVLHEIAQQVL